MASPYYVSPEQVVQDRSEFVQKGIKKAREVIVLEYQDGLAIVAENPLTTVFKVSEIYDRIAFAATGLYREYEALRYVGIRDAEVKGLTYTREDVTAKWLTNVYSQYIGGNFWQIESKPLEVELLICEVKESPSLQNRIYHLSFDGTFWEEDKYAVVGGRANSIAQFLDDTYSENLDLKGAIELAIKTFESLETDSGADELYEVNIETVEIAILDINRGRRKFRRLSNEDLNEILA